MQNALAIHQMERKDRALFPWLDERLHRQWAAVEASAYGWGGIQAVAQPTGLSPTTIRKGQSEVTAYGVQATRTSASMPAAQPTTTEASAGNAASAECNARTDTSDGAREPEKPIVADSLKWNIEILSRMN